MVCYAVGFFVVVLQRITFVEIAASSRSIASEECAYRLRHYGASSHKNNDFAHTQTRRQKSELVFTPISARCAFVRYGTVRLQYCTVRNALLLAKATSQVYLY